MKMALRVMSIVASVLMFEQVAAAQQYNTVVAVMETSVKNVVTGGTVIPYKEVTLSAKISGRVNFVAGEEGSSFKANDLLTVISDDDIRARRRAAYASLLAAQANLQNARVQYNRELYSPSINGQSRSSGFGMPSMFDKVFTRPLSSGMGLSNPGLQRYTDLQNQYNVIQQAQSQVLSAKARLEELDVNLRDTRQLAPFDGIIVQKLVETGTTVQPGTPLLKFAFVDYLRIQAEVPVRLVSSLKVLDILPAHVDAGGGVDIEVRVAQIFPVADQARHTVTVKFDLPKGVPGGPGMYAEVQIPDPDASGEGLVVIPFSAIEMQGSLPRVYVVKDGRKTMRLVRLGDKKSNGNVSIISGIAAGEQVIVQPASSLNAQNSGSKSEGSSSSK